MVHKLYLKLFGFTTANCVNKVIGHQYISEVNILN